MNCVNNDKGYSKISFNNTKGAAESMFYDCTSLKYITFKISFTTDTNNVTYYDFAKNVPNDG